MFKKEKFSKAPLPRRREFWTHMPKMIEGGTVLIEEGVEEQQDATHAAQAHLIHTFETQAIESFTSPILQYSDDSFYATFGSTYLKDFVNQEEVSWQKMGQEIIDSISQDSQTNLSTLQSAYLTLHANGRYEKLFASSGELWVTLAVFAHTYELKLKEKYGAEYSTDLFYKNLQKNIPVFLKRFIALDSITHEILFKTLVTNNPEEKGAPLASWHTQNLRLFELGDDNQFWFKSNLIHLVHQHAQDEGFTKDISGRTENRGCPFLHSKEPMDLLSFAVDELIKQHRAYAKI